jgi:hypothetical protein
MFSLLTGSTVDQTFMIMTLLNIEVYGDCDVSKWIVDGKVQPSRIVKVYETFINLVDENLGLTKFAFPKLMSYETLLKVANKISRKSPYSDKQTGPAMFLIANLVAHFNLLYTPEIHIGHTVGRCVGGFEIITNLHGEGSFANRYIKGPLEIFFQRQLKKSDFGQIGFAMLTKADLPPECLLDDNDDFEEFVEIDGKMYCYCIKLDGVQNSSSFVLYILEINH